MNSWTRPDRRLLLPFTGNVSPDIDAAKFSAAANWLHREDVHTLPSMTPSTLRLERALRCQVATREVDKTGVAAVLGGHVPPGIGGEGCDHQGPQERYASMAHTPEPLPYLWGSLYMFCKCLSG